MVCGDQHKSYTHKKPFACECMQNVRYNGTFVVLFQCMLLYPLGTPNPDTMYTILRYTIRLYGKKRIVETQNRIFGQG
jgi:hypothetical protein